MTMTQHAALLDAINAGFAAIHERLDRMEKRENEIERTLEPIEPAPPCGYPPEPAPEGMRWRR